MADDPTSFTALSAVDLSRRGIRLLGRSPDADMAVAARRDGVGAKIDAAFGDGIGRFHFGMTLQEVNSLLRQPFDERGLSTLPQASEYKKLATSDISGSGSAMSRTLRRPALARIASCLGLRSPDVS